MQKSEITVELVMRLLRRLPPDMVVEFVDMNQTGGKAYEPTFTFSGPPGDVVRGSDEDYSTLMIHRATPGKALTPKQHLERTIGEFEAE